MDAQAERSLRQRSALWFGFFVRAFRHAFRRDFHALRVSRSGPAPDPATPRLVFYANHPSWWDAIAFVLLADAVFAGRAGFVPIDARMLRRYGFMARIGAFGVDLESPMGGAAFLAVAEKLLARPDGLLLVTAQGRFADVRERPVRLRPGLAHLAARRLDATFVPLALDYVFWDERQPEMLVRFGPPIPATSLLALPVPERTAVLGQALEATMDGLAREAIARDPAAFETLVGGRAGVGGVYDLWRRAQARSRGERFSPAHGDGQ
jgi:1-acyl-sn-glycerol-3-phosphate acyltransferase